MNIFTPINTLSPFMNTTNYLPPDEEARVIRVQELFNQAAKYLNVREVSIYETVETITGQQWPITGDVTKKRTTFRKIYEFGAINAGATLNIPLLITNFLQMTKIDGSVITAVPDQRPINYSDEAVVTNQFSVKIVGANIVIINGATAPNITSGIIILEYLKN